MSHNSHQHKFKMILHNTLVNFTQTQYNKCKIWLTYNTAWAVLPRSQAKASWLKLLFLTYTQKS